MAPSSTIAAPLPRSARAGTALVERNAAGRRDRVGDNEVVALPDVSLRIGAEDFVVVLGPSGSGKSTLLNMVGALDSPTEGRDIPSTLRVVE